MSIRKKVIILGAPASGKTNYLNASLQYFSVHSGENYRGIEVKSANEKMAKAFACITHQFQEGCWFPKTQNFNCLELDIKCPWGENWLTRLLTFGLEVRVPLSFMDLSGEHFNALTGKEGEEMKTKAINHVKTCDAIMLLIDANRFLNEDYMKKMEDNIAILADLIDERMKARNAKKNLKMSFVFTKVDMLSNEWKANDGCKLKARLRSHYFSNLFNTLEWFNAEYEYFCVSCVPEDSVRSVSSHGGIKPNEKWLPVVMKEQVKPFYWLFDAL